MASLRRMRAMLLAHTIIVPENLRAIGYSPHLDVDEVQPADELAEAAGRLCYKSWPRPNPKTRSNAGYMNHILEVEHFSILEHATATLYFDGVSRTLTHEFVRHRHLSPSQVSQRYVDERDGEFVMPLVLQEPLNNDLAHLLLAHHEASRKVYAQVADTLQDRGYSRKIGRGAARSSLPGGHETAIIMTGNHRGWREVIAKRAAPGADDEIRHLASAALQILRELAPNTYRDFEE